MTKSNIQMVDLISQYKKIKPELDQRLETIFESAQFINGPDVLKFRQNFSKYLNVPYVVPCANGTDALQLALMALELQPGDEVIIPAFTYIATIEIISLLKLKPVVVDVDPETFNIDPQLIEQVISPRTKAVIPVHLFGQCCDMDALINISNKYGISIVEDNAQSIGARCIIKGERQMSGTIGDIGCTSFFPSKNLGCYGDGGALITQNEELNKKLTYLVNHGQSKKYYHDHVGVNSRLDSIQAAVLDIKLKYLNDYILRRQEVAETYNKAFSSIEEIITPYKAEYTEHVYHQYTLKIKNDQRDALKSYLSEHAIPSMIYYPMPVYQQKAYSSYFKNVSLSNTEELCASVLSLPIHTEMDKSTQSYIIDKVLEFYR